jgi:hypothetical protein
VALAYLLDQLVQNQQGLIEEAKRTLPRCKGFPEARQLVEAILSVQQTIAHDLEELAKEAQASQSKTV